MTSQALERVTQRRDGAERLDPQPWLRECADEPLRHPVACGRSDEGRAGGHPEEPELGLEVVAPGLAALIRPDLHARRDPRRDGPDRAPAPLAEELQGLEAGGPRRRMKPDPFPWAMIDHHEAGHGAVLQGHHARGVGAL
jgi:hypothetical protein